MTSKKPELDSRGEWHCKHGIGHQKGIHGCDGCCDKKGLPREGAL